MKQKEQLGTQIWQINTKFLQSAIACAQDVYGNIPQEDSSTEKQREKVSSQNDGNMLRDAINYAVDKCKEDYEDEEVSAPFHTALQEMKKDFGEFEKKIGKFIEKKKEKQVRKAYNSLHPKAISLPLIVTVIYLNSLLVLQNFTTARKSGNILFTTLVQYVKRMLPFFHALVIYFIHAFALYLITR